MGTNDGLNAASQKSSDKPDEDLASPVLPPEISSHNVRHFFHSLKRWLTLNTFAPSWLSARFQPWFIGYLLTILLPLVVAFIAVLFGRLGGEIDFIDVLDLLVVLLISLGWGAAPGVVTTLLSTLTLALLTIFHPLPIDTPEIADVVDVVLYFIVGLTMSLLVGQVQRARIEAEKARIQVEYERAHLRDLFMQAPFPTVVLRGPDHRFELVNPAAREIAGEDLTGQVGRDIIPEFEGALPILDHIYTTGEAVSLKEWQLPIRYCGDGMFSYVYLNMVYHPIRNPQGEVDGIVVFSVDLTEQVLARKQIEKLVAQLQEEKEALHQSEQQAVIRANQLEAIFESITDGLCIVDIETGARQMNRAARELFGESESAQADQLWKPLFELYDEQGNLLPDERWPHERILAGEELKGAQAADVVMHAHDGRTVSLAVTGAPVRTVDGQIRHTVLAYRDVTDRRNLEQMLREAERAAAERASQLEAIFEAIADGLIILYTHDPVPYMNHATWVMLGLPDGTKMDMDDDRRPFNLLDEQGNLLTHEQWPDKRVRRGEYLQGANAVEAVLQTQDGRKRDFSVTGAPLWSPEREPIGAVLVCRDVTERRQLERRTQEALQALLALAGALVQLPMSSGQTMERAEPVPLQVFGQRLVELISRVLGYKRVGLISVDSVTQKLHSIAVVGISPECEQIWRERCPFLGFRERLAESSVGAQLAQGEIVVVDLHQLRFAHQINPYGIDRMSTMLLVPIRIGTRLTGILTLYHGDEEYVYTANDIALAKAVGELAALILERERLLGERAESQARVLALHEANRSKDEFIGIAGHELRTPLTTIKASVQLAKKQLNRVMKQEAMLPDDVVKMIATVQTFLDRTERQAGMQNRLINALLDVSRIEVGRMALNLVHYDLVTLVREVVEDQRALTPERRILLEIEAPEAVPAMLDVDRLCQVVTNYLSNALKYSDVDKDVLVRIDVCGSQARVSVCDKGPGLNEIEQQRIWERFYRVPGVEVKSGSSVGLGLGLYISRTIVEQQGGEVGVQSKPGEGSTFWFILPISKNTDSPF